MTTQTSVPNTPQTAKKSKVKTCENCAHREPFGKRIICDLTKSYKNRLLAGCSFWASAYKGTINGP